MDLGVMNFFSTAEIGDEHEPVREVFEDIDSAASW